MTIAAALAVVAQLWSTGPDVRAIVAETFPDDATRAWPVMTLDHTRVPSGELAVDPHMCAATADPATGAEYLLQLGRTRQGGAWTSCAVYDRAADGRWSLLATDPRC